MKAIQTPSAKKAAAQARQQKEDVIHASRRRHIQLFDDYVLNSRLRVQEKANEQPQIQDLINDFEMERNRVISSINWEYLLRAQKNED